MKESCIIHEYLHYRHIFKDLFFSITKQCTGSISPMLRNLCTWPLSLNYSWILDERRKKSKTNCLKSKKLKNQAPKTQNPCLQTIDHKNKQKPFANNRSCRYFDDKKRIWCEKRTTEKKESFLHFFPTFLFAIKWSKKTRKEKKKFSSLVEQV